VVFGPIFQSALRGFFFIGTSATKRSARSRICRYGWPQDILSKKQIKREGGAFSAPPPWIKGLTNCGNCNNGDRRYCMFKKSCPFLYSCFIKMHNTSWTYSSLVRRKYNII